MLPLASSTCGSGSCCSIGSKWLGIRPILEQHKKNVDQGQKECFHNSNVKWGTVSEGLKFGTELAKDLGKII